MLARALRLCIFGGLLTALLFSGCGRSDVLGYEEDEAGRDARRDVTSDVRDTGIDGDAARDVGDAADARDVVIPTDGDAACGPGTCTGCCVGGKCLVGLADTQCGAEGVTCGNCLAVGQVCFPRDPLLGGVCDIAPVACDATSCPKGCCSGNACIEPGNTDTACGIGGATCDNCISKGQTCDSSNKCVAVPPKCTPQNCSGCCDANGDCQLGFAANTCGSTGNACVNCASQGATCAVNTTPRVCSNQTTCPSPYGGCKGATTTPPKVQDVCSVSDLDNAQAACGGGADSAPCNEFFQQIAVIKPKCGSCLEPYHEPLADWRGVHVCVAPFVSSTCNGQTGCYEDCTTASCDTCSAGQKNQCESQVRSSQCSSYLTTSFSCVLPALLGQGSFCNPLIYSGYGEWLRAVGDHYCGQ